MAPCPLYKLRDGRYILIYHNNVGDANQGRHFMDWCRNRRPVYVSVGREVPAQDEQPLMFAQGRVLADNDRVPISRKQLTEKHQGRPEAASAPIACSGPCCASWSDPTPQSRTACPRSSCIDARCS